LKGLSYRIKKNRKGHYALLNLDAPAPAIAEMERRMGLHEDILRFMTVRVEEHETGPSAMMQARSAGREGGRGRDRDRGERGDRDRGRGERGERGERGDRGERGERDRGDRGERGGERGERGGERGERERQPAAAAPAPAAETEGGNE
jgi:small subunit ribosomal protein S6